MGVNRDRVQGGIQVEHSAFGTLRRTEYRPAYRCCPRYAFTTKASYSAPAARNMTKRGFPFPSRTTWKRYALKQHSSAGSPTCLIQSWRGRTVYNNRERQIHLGRSLRRIDGRGLHSRAVGRRHALPLGLAARCHRRPCWNSLGLPLGAVHVR